MKAYVPSRAILLVALAAALGCPQLKEDDFEPRVNGVNGVGGVGGSAASGAAGTAGVAGLGGNSACDVASGGCGVDAGPESNGGSAGSVQGDGGTASEPNVVGCGSDEVTAPNGVCYFVDSTTSTWADARTSCQARGASWDLVGIYDLARNDFVLSITGFEAWIGATDAAEEGTWVWVDTDTPFFEAGAVTSAGYANWTVGEPNDYDGSDCLRMLTTGEWADWPCSSLLGHVCRRAP